MILEVEAELAAAVVSVAGTLEYGSRSAVVQIANLQYGQNSAVVGSRLKRGCRATRLDLSHDYLLEGLLDRARAHESRDRSDILDDRRMIESLSVAEEAVEET